MFSLVKSLAVERYPKRSVFGLSFPEDVLATNRENPLYRECN